MELATPQDIEHIIAAAKGLSVAKIRMTFAACGMPAPATSVTADHLFDAVPKVKAQILTEALAGVER